MRPLPTLAAALGSALTSRFLGAPGAVVGVGGAAYFAAQGDADLALGLGLGAGLGLLLRGAQASLWGDLPLRPALALTLWNGDPLEDAWAEQAAIFARLQPQVIILHVGVGGGTGAANVAAAARATVPGIRVWTQVSATFDVRSTVATGARVVQATGSEAVGWNGERAFKNAGGADAARGIVEGFAATGLPVVQMQSAYGDPTLHSSYPWAAWFGPGGCQVSLAQDYPFADDVTGTVADGSLTSRIERDTVGWARAVERGMVPASVIRGTYVPSAHIETADIVRACAGIPYVAVWPWHGRYDEQALRAFEQIRAQRS